MRALKELFRTILNAPKIKLVFDRSVLKNFAIFTGKQLC